MTDRIELRGLRLLGHHGALPGEQDRAQPFELDIDVETNTAAAAASDDLADAVDYGGVVAAVAAVVETERFSLLERLAAVVAERVLALPRVDGVVVTVRKLRPPVPFDLGDAGVRIERRSAR